MRAFAEALEVVPFTLAENAGLSPIAVGTSPVPSSCSIAVLYQACCCWLSVRRHLNDCTIGVPSAEGQMQCFHLVPVKIANDTSQAEHELAALRSALETSIECQMMSGSACGRMRGGGTGGAD